MITRGRDYDRTFDLLDELRRQMDRVWNDFDEFSGASSAPSGQARSLAAATWPRLNVFDAGANLVVTGDVPGLSEKDIEITLHDGVLSLSGERKTTAPEGYAARRQERPAFRFARSLALPSKVDPERTTAVVKDGVLTITLAKTPDARPRQITVRAS
jgi:HSP20 family protein